MLKKTDFAAYTVPFIVFMVFLAMDGVVTSFKGDGSSWWLATPKYWIYPLQTVVCGGLLLYYWRHYSFGSIRPWWLGVVAGAVVLLLWISPQAFLGFARREDGFNPEALAEEGWIYHFTVLARFARLVIIVPLMEEIFWRGFLMRYLIKEDFTSVAFGAFKPVSFFGVAGLFMLVHSMADWPAALLTGIIYNGLAVKTKSLFACVLAHAITNLGLGIYIMATRQWGFW